jgi:hypothetical protein
MAYTVTKVNVWAGEVADRPGGLASTLTALQNAGGNIEFVVARRAADMPGTGVVFVSPIKGAKQKNAAERAGLATSESLHSVRVEGPDRAGLGAKMTEALAAAGIKLRGISSDQEAGADRLVIFGRDLGHRHASAEPSQIPFEGHATGLAENPLQVGVR